MGGAPERPGPGLATARTERGAPPSPEGGPSDAPRTRPRCSEAVVAFVDARWPSEPKKSQHCLRGGFCGDLFPRRTKGAIGLWPAPACMLYNLFRVSPRLLDSPPPPMFPLVTLREGAYDGGFPAWNILEALRCYPLGRQSPFPGDMHFAIQRPSYSSLWSQPPVCISEKRDRDWRARSPRSRTARAGGSIGHEFRPLICPPARPRTARGAHRAQTGLPEEHPVSA